MCQRIDGLSRWERERAKHIVANRTIDVVYDWQDALTYGLGRVKNIALKRLYGLNKCLLHY